MNENWAIDLLIGDGDVENYNKFSLVYVAGSQERYKLEQSGGIGNAVTGSISGQAPIVIQHVSDSEAPEPARLTEANKRGSWRISVFDDENETPKWDSILNNIHAINRHFSGASSTAARHSVNGSAENVRIAITPEGATSTTYFDVRYGHADVSQCYYTAASQQTDGTNTKRGAWFIPVNLVFTEAGYGDSFTLRNDLPSSPHMIEDSNGDGLADGLALVGTPTTAINSTAWLIGGVSQEITTDAATAEGVTTDYVTVAADEPYFAYVWITRLDPSGDRILITVQGAGLVQLDQKTFDPSSPSGYDKVSRDAKGNAWYRYSFSDDGSGPRAASDVKFRIAREAVFATTATRYYIDGLYIQTGTTVISVGWCSSSSLKNRYDPASTSAATQQQINYLDVWGVPGDLPALMKMFITGSSGSNRDALMMFAFTGNRKPAQSYQYWFDDTSFILGGGTDWTRTAGTGTSEDSYLTYTAPVSISDRVSGIIANGWDIFRAQPVRVYASVYVSSNVPSIRLGFGSETVVYQWTEFKKPETTGAFLLIDFGLINIQDRFIDYPFEGALYLHLDENDSASGTVRVDFVNLMPTDALVITSYDDTWSSRGWSIDGTKKETASSIDATTFTKVGAQGGVYDVAPGRDSTRIVMFTRGDEAATSYEQYSIASLLTISDFQIIPRTSHLLGTQ